MGVSLSLDGKDITPGWRSMMHMLLGDEFGYGIIRFHRDDLEKLEYLRDNQCKDDREPPFDYSVDVATSFQAIIDRVNEKGSALYEPSF